MPKDMRLLPGKTFQSGTLKHWYSNVNPAERVQKGGLGFGAAFHRFVPCLLVINIADRHNRQALLADFLDPVPA